MTADDYLFPPLAAKKLLYDLLGKKDACTLRHCLNVADISLRISKVFNLDSKQESVLYSAALLHDIGKAYIPDEILNKAGKLTSDEYLNIQRHPAAGGNLLRDYSVFSGEIENIVRHHHERFDGTGYPDNLSGSEIPLEARIIAVADAYDAITTRQYSADRSKRYALGEIKRHAGTQFDYEVAEGFFDII